jgi:hypothetical protein
MKIQEKLLSLNFKNIGFWRVSNNFLEYQITSEFEYEIEIPNSLYIFYNDKEDKIMYVGKTTQTLKKRLYQYTRGNGKSTNQKINKNIQKIIEKSNSISIWVLNDNLPFSWGPYNINLAAGLEDSIIEIENPIWNGKISETEENEKFLQTAETNDLEQTEPYFFLTMQRTYLKIGSINFPSKLSDLLGKHGEEIKIFFKRDTNNPINLKINRNAVKNRSVRINQNKVISEYFQKNYKLGEKVKITVLGKNKIEIS